MRGRIQIWDKNEYYWFSQQHKKQYDLGTGCVRKGNSAGYYSQGVGAANYSYKLFLKNKPKQALKWAIVAEKSWLNYFKYRTKKYYDPWAWYALSLGLQGKNIDMEKALKTSAKLSQRSIQHPFFQKIRRMARQKE